MKYIAILSILIWFFFIMIGEWYVDDCYLYNVKSMKQIFPGDYIEPKFSGTRKQLSFFGYIMAKRAKAIIDAYNRGELTK